MEAQSYKKQSTQYYSDATRFTSGFELAVITRLRYYIAELLYTSEIDNNNLTASMRDLIKRRVFPANMTNDFALRTDVKSQVYNSNQNNNSDVNYFSNSNNLPFTVYNLGETPELDETEMNMPAALSKIYCPELGTYMTAIPIKQTYEFTSFFNTAQDYNEAILRMNLDSALLTRMSFPILLNNIPYNFYLDLQDWQLAKGEYASDFEVMLEKNKIYDLVHNVEITYLSIFPNKNLTVHNVKDMAVHLYDIDVNNLNSLGSSISLVNINTAVSFTTNFTNNQINWPKTSSLIFTFNSAIVEASFTNNFTIDKNLLYRIDASSNGLTFTISPFGGSFLASTKYTITIPKMKIQNENGYWYKSDITLTFTTGV